MYMYILLPLWVDKYLYELVNKLVQSYSGLLECSNFLYKIIDLAENSHIFEFRGNRCTTASI